METFNVTNTIGNTVAQVQPQTIDNSSTSLALIGDKAANYGLPQSENFVKLLENFSGPNAPNAPMLGQLWYNTNLKRLQIYKDGAWGDVTSGVDFATTGTDPTLGGLAVAIHCYVTGANKSILLLFAGGLLIAAVSPVAIDNSHLPTNVTILNTVYDVQGRFPNGILAGVSLSTDAADYIFNGHVKAADQSTFVGGGSPLAATSFATIGNTTVLFNISGGNCICAYSSVAIPNANLPFTVLLAGQTIAIRSVFPNGLGQGISLATGSTIFGYVTLQDVTSLVTAQGAANASAINAVYAWVDSQSATAIALNRLETEFTTATGQQTTAQAINYILAQSTPDGSTASAITTLQAQMNNTQGSALSANISSAATAYVSPLAAQTSRVDSLSTTVNGGPGVPALTARVSTAEGTLTTLSGKNQAWLSQTVEAGGARALVSLQADGISNQSNIDLVAGTINLSNGSGSLPALSVANGNVQIYGTLQANSIYTNMLVDNSVTKTASIFVPTRFPGNISSGTVPSPPPYISIINYTITVNSVSSLFVLVTADQGYTSTSGLKPWQLYILVDGTGIGISGGSGAYTDAASCSGTTANLSVGNHNIQLLWYGHQNITLSNISMYIQAIYK